MEQRGTCPEERLDYKSLTHSYLETEIQDGPSSDLVWFGLVSFRGLVCSYCLLFVLRHIKFHHPNYNDLVTR